MGYFWILSIFVPELNKLLLSFSDSIDVSTTHSPTGSIDFSTGSAGGSAGSINLKVGVSNSGKGQPVALTAGATTAPGGDGGSINLSGGESLDPDGQGTGGGIQIQVTVGWVSGKEVCMALVGRAYARGNN